MTATKYTTIVVDASHYEDHDECLAAAQEDCLARLDLRGWDLEPRWHDEDRETIALDVPTWRIQGGGLPSIYRGTDALPAEADVERLEAGHG